MRLSACMNSVVEGIQYGGGISSVRWKYSVQMCHIINMEDARHQYDRGYTSYIHSVSDIQVKRKSALG